LHRRATDDKDILHPVPGLPIQDKRASHGAGQEFGAPIMAMMLDLWQQTFCISMLSNAAQGVPERADKQAEKVQRHFDCWMRKQSEADISKLETRMMAALAGFFSWLISVKYADCAGQAQAPVFRFVADDKRCFYYTTDPADNPQHWNANGYAFLGITSASKDLVPVRQYHADNPKRFNYTAGNPGPGWQEDKVAFYAYARSMAGTVPIYEYH
jgi:hypothetical protein